jgi:hypothetical protein
LGPGCEVKLDYIQLPKYGVLGSSNQSVTTIPMYHAYLPRLSDGEEHSSSPRPLLSESKLLSP